LKKNIQQTASKDMVSGEICPHELRPKIEVPKAIFESNVEGGVQKGGMG